MFSHQKSVKKPSFYMTFSKGSCFAKIRVSCQTFKMDIEKSFSLTPHFWPFKNHSTGQKSCFLIRRVLKSLFCYTTSPQKVLSCQNKSQLSNLQNGHREKLFFNPHFWPFKNHSTGQKSCFLIRRVLKKPFLLYNLPPGGLVLPK